MGEMVTDFMKEMLQNPHRHDPSSSLFVGPRGLAVKILSRVEQSDAYLDRLLEYELGLSGMSDRDRRLLTELSTGVLRWQARLDWVLSGFYRGEYARALTVVRNSLRVALYQIMHLDRIPHSAAVNESVRIVKRLKGNRSAGIVNGVLRAIIRRLDDITWPSRDQDETRYLSIMLSHPAWMVRRWIHQFGAVQTEALLRANNERAPIVIRPNPMRTTSERLRTTLVDHGIRVHPGRLAPDALVLDGSGSIAVLQSFRNGHFTVQDEGAILASRLTGAQPGMTVIDLCSAPGGKTSAIAEMMRGSGRVIAVDLYESRLERVAENARRLGFGDMIEQVCGDARSIELPPADVVLVDAPCSGLGTLSRKPDIKWKRQHEDLMAMTRLADAILENGARMVRPGGALVYTTCSIDPEENDDVVARFVTEHPEFAFTNSQGVVPTEAIDGPFLRTLPHRHGIDGAFGAVMRRRE